MSLLVRFWCFSHMHIDRAVEILKFYTCPGTSKWPKCTCTKKIFTCPKEKITIAYTLLCLNNI